MMQFISHELIKKLIYWLPSTFNDLHLSEEIIILGYKQMVRIHKEMDMAQLHQINIYSIF